MKTLIFLAFALLASPVFADVRLLEADAFSTEEKAAEAEATINQNFSDLFNAKAGTSEKDLVEPRFTVSDILNPELFETNAIFIMENADDLWREKKEISVEEQGSRSYFLSSMDDEDAIEIINQILIEIDLAKEDL